MRAIFISYRRSDTEGEAGRLSDLLTHRFSDQSVFMDVDSIQPGRDFRKAIEESIRACSVMLTLIGPSWLDATDDRGGRRLDAANDYVRLEIAAALRRDIPVVPVLLRGARMPHADQLPTEIQDLAYRNSVELTHARWKSDLQVLIAALEPYLNYAPAEPQRIPVPPAPPVYVHAGTHHPVPTPARPGPSARRSAYTTPLPPSPFARTTPISHIAPSVPPRITERPPAPIPARVPTPLATDASAPVHIPTYLPPAQLPTQPLPPSAPIALPPTPESAPPPAPVVGELPPDAVARISQQLAHFIGPIAEIVVKRAAKRTASLDDLCAAVAHEIESGTDRARFLTLCRH